MSAMSQSVRNKVKPGANKLKRRPAQMRDVNATERGREHAERRAKVGVARRHRSQSHGNDAMSRRGLVENEPDALTGVLEMSKAKSTASWASIISKNADKVPSQWSVGSGLRGVGVSEDGLRAATREQSEGNGFEQFPEMDDAEAEELEGAEEGQGERHALPPESVSGYRTSVLMIHPNHPLKIIFDLVIGGAVTPVFVHRGGGEGGGAHGSPCPPSVRTTPLCASSHPIQRGVSALSDRLPSGGRLPAARLGHDNRLPLRP